MSRKLKPDFQKAKKSRIFQDVVEQIQDAIMEKKLHPGDVLPPERELRETFNVSRGTLREALRVLEQKGLIEIRLGTGGGSIVKEAGTDQLTESLSLLIRSGRVSLIDIAEFRQGLEGMIASMAAERASAKDIHRLEKLVNKAELLTMKGDAAAWEHFLTVDQQIHKELAEIAGNALFRFAVQVVQDNIRKYYDQYLEFSLSRMQENCEDLQNIVMAVKEGRAGDAARIAEQHVYAFNVKMIEKKAVLMLN